MIRPSAPTASKVLGRAGLTLGGGAGGGWLATLAADPKTKVAIVIAAVAGALITNGLAKAIESIYKRRPQTIRAKGEAKARVITAKSEAKALKNRTKQQGKLLAAGLNPGRTEAAAEMVRLQAAASDLLADRRLRDDARAKLLTPPKNSGRERPGSGGPQDGDPGTGAPPGNVRPIR